LPAIVIHLSDAPHTAWMTATASSSSDVPSSVASLRVAAGIVDLVLFLLYAGILFAVVWSTTSGEPAWTENPWVSQALGGLMTTLVFAAYFVWTEGTGRVRASVGKRLFRLRVARADGEGAAGIGSVVLRTVVKLAPWELGHTPAHHMMLTPMDAEPPLWAAVVAILSCLLAVVWVVALWLPGGRGVHDLVAGTRVVRVSGSG
jgi:uncharacterized RDD family membrane protein YckC